MAKQPKVPAGAAFQAEFEVTSHQVSRNEDAIQVHEEIQMLPVRLPPVALMVGDPPLEGQVDQRPVQIMGNPEGPNFHWTVMPTPNGSIILHLTAPAAMGSFHTGERYRVYFVPVD